MRFERLVIEANENTFSLDFHPRLTVISGVGRLEREGLISELIGSMSSSRPGVHAEITADNGNRFAIFRPYGARARVIDVDAATDVSSRFADHEGRIDLLAVAKLDARSAKRALRLSGSDLTTSTHHDQIVRRLALTDSDTLWSTADRVAESQAKLDDAAAESGSAPEDAAVAARIEAEHDHFEEAQARAETVRKVSFVGGALSALAAVPSAMYVSQVAAMGWIILAATVTAISFIQNQRMEVARKRESEALAAAGAESYLGFHLQRVNGLLDSEQARRRLVQAGEEHNQAMQAWFEVAGEIVPEWAYEHRAEISEAASHLQHVSAFASASEVVEGNDEITALAHAMMQRINAVRTIGPAGESMPLLLDDSLHALPTDLKAPLLEMLFQASAGQQIVFMTQDRDVTDWARVEAITGDLSILEPGPVNSHSDVEQQSIA